MSLIRLSITLLSSFIFGMPYLNSPPALSLLSYTVTLCPRLFNSCATVSPEGPLPITATLFPVRVAGVSGFTSPFSYAYSMIAFSFSLVETGAPISPQVHAASQSAGHTLEVNSGKQCVLLSLTYACSRLPLYTRSFVSGTRLLSGHPDAIPPIMVPA